MKALMHCSFGFAFVIYTAAVSPIGFGEAEPKHVRPDEPAEIDDVCQRYLQQTNELFRWDQRTCRIGAVNRELIFVFAVDDIKLDFPENSAFFDTVLQFMRAMPSVELEIGQHLGGYHRMQRSQMVRLTQMRAEAIVNRLIANGIDSKRLVPRGYGDLQPLISREEIAAMERQEKEQAHRMNRRTEFKIIRCDRTIRPFMED